MGKEIKIASFPHRIKSARVLISILQRRSQVHGPKNLVSPNQIGSPKEDAFDLEKLNDAPNHIISNIIL